MMAAESGSETTMRTKNDDPRVWIGCLSCYNDGTLVGEWFDADKAGDVTVQQVHGNDDNSRQTHEELQVMDHENFWGLLDWGQCSPREAQRIAEILLELSDDNEREAFGAYVDNHGKNNIDEDTLEDFCMSYRGVYESEEDYARQLAEDTGGIADYSVWPLSCIDWKDAADELFRYGDEWSYTGTSGIHVFSA